MKAYNSSVTNTEKAIALEPCYPNQIGKFYVPILMPGLDTDAPYKKQVNPPSTSNVVSGTAASFGVDSYYEANYVEIKSPYKVFKDSQVVVNILNGTTGAYDLSNLNVVGEYDEYASNESGS